jgi:oligopeptide/dipeptide ABC transporter ATP-binding protein
VGADYDALRCWFCATALPSVVGVIILTFLLPRALPGGPTGYFVSQDRFAAECWRCISAAPSKAVRQRRCFAAPAHPYTQALLSAIPKPGARSTRIALTSEPRSPIDPDPAVCRLYGRCARATDLCRSVAPLLRQVATGQHVACHHAVDEIGMASAASLAIAASS